jgi:hypothetical protein
LTVLSTAAATVCLAALFLERPAAERLSAAYDTISIVHVVALSLSAALAWTLRLVHLRTGSRRLLAGIVGGAGVALLLYRAFPLFFHGPLAEASPFIFEQFLPVISEAQRFYEIAPGRAVAVLWLPVLALVALLCAWLKPRMAFYTQVEALPLLFFGLVCTALLLMQQRWLYYALPLAITLLAPIAGAALTPHHPQAKGRWPASALYGLPERAQALRRLPMLALLLFLPWIVLITAELLKPKPHATVAATKTSTAAKIPTDAATLKRDSLDCLNEGRRLIRSGILREKLGDAAMILLAPTDLGTEILFFTPYRIVASNYHREGEAIRYVWQTQGFAEATKLRAHLATRRIQALLVCPTQSAAKGSILQGLAYGTPAPDFLKPIPYRLPPKTSKSSALPKPALVPALFFVTPLKR